MILLCKNVLSCYFPLFLGVSAGWGFGG